MAADVAVHTIQRGKLRRTIVASTIGAALEWYDFAVYGFLAPIIGKLFFPSDDPVTSLLAAFGAFAIGYAARAIGGAIFGYVGDRLGRKTSLIISILVMGVATFAIGILPDYSQIGKAAAVLMITLRIIQGLSVGGEYPGALVFLAEHVSPKRRGIDTSWCQFGTVAGFLAGSTVSALTATFLGQEAMDEWAWRIPFLIGGAIAFIGLFMRRGLTEPPAVRRLDRAAGSPVVVALRDHWRTLLRMVPLIVGSAVGFYMIFIYATSYLTEHMHVSTARALDITTACLVLYLGLTPLAAMLSDRVGRKPMIAGVAIATVVFSWPLWWLMHQDDSLLILAGQMGYSVIFSTGFAVLPATLAEMLPYEVRCSGVAVGYNICLSVFGGTAPLVATYLVALTADDFTPVYYLMAAGALQLMAAVGLREMSRRPLP